MERLSAIEETALEYRKHIRALAKLPPAYDKLNPKMQEWYLELARRIESGENNHALDENGELSTPAQFIKRDKEK